MQIKDSVESTVIIKRSGDADLTEEELEALISGPITITESLNGNRVTVTVNGEDITIDDADETD